MKLISELYNDGEITSLAKSLFKEERAKQRLDGWFLSREIAFQ